MEIPVEKHPLKPFLPANAKLLMLGSFPPPRHRWCMDFYYPNPQNDMWRIFGHVFFGDKTHFLNGDNRTFNRERVVEFVLQTGVALYDTACAVRRLKANAADQFLEVAENTDIAKLLKKIPECRAIVTTGEKATDVLCEWSGAEKPAVGSFSRFTYKGENFLQFRMPSSSRAYPMKLEKKAEYYAAMFRTIGFKVF